MLFFSCRTDVLQGYSSRHKLLQDADVALTAETVADCLSVLCKTGDGLSHAYVRLDASDRYVVTV